MSAILIFSKFFSYWADAISDCNLFSELTFFNYYSYFYMTLSLLYNMKKIN